MKLKSISNIFLPTIWNSMKSSSNWKYIFNHALPHILPTRGPQYTHTEVQTSIRDKRSTLDNFFCLFPTIIVDNCCRFCWSWCCCTLLYCIMNTIAGELCLVLPLRIQLFRISIQLWCRVLLVYCKFICTSDPPLLFQHGIFHLYGETKFA